MGICNMGMQASVLPCSGKTQTTDVSAGGFGTCQRVMRRPGCCYWGCSTGPAVAWCSLVLQKLAEQGQGRVQSPGGIIFPPSGGGREAITLAEPFLSTRALKWPCGQAARRAWLGQLGLCSSQRHSRPALL